MLLHDICVAGRVVVVYKTASPLFSCFHWEVLCFCGGGGGCAHAARIDLHLFVWGIALLKHWVACIFFSIFHPFLCFLCFFAEGMKRWTDHLQTSYQKVSKLYCSSSHHRFVLECRGTDLLLFACDRNGRGHQNYHLPDRNSTSKRNKARSRVFYTALSRAEFQGKGVLTGFPLWILLSFPSCL